MISIITATSVTGIIGIKGVNDLLWHCKKDLEFFKKMTTGKNVVMGNNTFKSLRGNPLPDRLNLVLSRSEEPGNRNGVIYFNNMRDIVSTYESLVVIGGYDIYNLFIPIADEVCISTISLDIQGGQEFIYFPVESMEKEFYMEAESPIITDIDEESGLDISIIISRWNRKIPKLH